MGVVSFILLIVFWLKIAGYSRQLAEDTGPRGWQRKLEDFDDDDDFRRDRPADAPRPPPDAYKEQDPGQYH
jgi:hypothetical protein